MRFQSERDQRLAASVISQMIVLIETLIQRMEPVQSATDLSATDFCPSAPGGRLYAVSRSG